MQAGEKAYDIAADHVLSAVARSGSFTKAARACFVSQTAISRQISALEEELHVTLLERDTAHVKLTLAGEYFFQQVNELTARLEEVVTRTQTIAQEQQTHLTLGIPTILEQHAISQLLRQYHSLHPEVQLSTVADSRQQLVSQLVDRKIDLLVAMDFDLPDLEGLDSIILQQVHATWLLPTGHPLAGAEKIAPQQLQGETLILTQEDPRGNTEELLRQYYNQLGLKGNPVLHTRTLEELFLLASAGVGIGLLPSQFFRIRGWYLLLELVAAQPILVRCTFDREESFFPPDAYPYRPSGL